MQTTCAMCDRSRVFGLDNLPYGVVGGRCVVRYGDHVLGLERFGEVFAAPSLNGFLARGRAFNDDAVGVSLVLQH